MSKTKKVLMIVANKGFDDIRVLRQAEFLEKSGFDVTVLGFHKNNEFFSETINKVNYKFYPYRHFGVLSKMKNSLKSILELLGFNFFTLALVSILLMSFFLLLSFVYFYLFLSNSNTNYFFGGFLCAIVTMTVLMPKKILGSISILAKKFLDFTGSFPDIKRYFSSALEEHIQRDKPDVIHCHDLNTLYPVMANKEKCGDIPIIYDAHELSSYDSGWKEPLKMLYKRTIMKKYLKGISGLITVSDFFVEHFKQVYKIANSAVVYNSQALDFTYKIDSIPKNTVRKALGLAEEDPLIIHIGGINRRRGSVELAKSLRELPKNYNFVFLTSSKNEVLNEIESIAKKNLYPEFGAQIHFLSAVPANEVRHFVSDADVSVITRLPPKWYFNPQREHALPNKLFEAVAAHLPMAMAACIANNQFVERYKIGATADIRNSKDFSLLIQNVYKNRHEYKVNEETYKLISARYGWHVSKTNLIKLYERILKPCEYTQL